MTISTNRQRELFNALQKLAQDRALRESMTVKTRDQGLADNESRHAQDTTRLAKEFREKRSGAEDEFLTQLSEARLVYESDLAEYAVDEQNVRDDIKLRRTQSQDAAKKAWRMEREHIGSVHAKQRQKHQRAWVEKQSIFEQHKAGLNHVQESFTKVLQKRGVELPPPENDVEVEAAGTPAEALTAFMEKLEATRQSLRRLVYLKSARFLEDGWPVLLFLLIAGGLAFLLWNKLQFNIAISGVAAVVGAAIATWGVCRLMKPWVRNASLKAGLAVRQTLTEGEMLFDAAYRQAKSAAENQIRQNEQQRDERLLDGDKAYTRKKQELDDEFDAHFDHEKRRLQQKKETFESNWEQAVKALARQFRPALDQLEKARTQREQELADRRAQESERLNREFEEQWGALVEAWQSGLASFSDEIQEMDGYCDERFAPWTEDRWSEWQPQNDPDLAAIRFGEYTVQLRGIPHGVPTHEDLKPPADQFAVPAVLSFPEQPSLMIRAQGGGRDPAIETIQNVMLRMLTAFPPGKVRFTIIDPVGLGQNFSAFMHLADYDDRFVTSRIWTESNHIQQRLADLTEHMENVIQKYLRNEFESIQQYNRNAGEVAEPFHILVVANFPANFTEESARRLVSIASSGARCGVYTLISVDDNAPPPRGFDIDDLAAGSGVLRWDETAETFFWKDESLGALPLRIEAPPSDEQFSQLVKSCGEFAKDASRVEVPFRLVAPTTDDDRWSRDSRKEISVPLGRAGATKLQSLNLGKGTSQHVLISGKTGSGKSTLLHAMITNTALYYSPREIELYLIDFKKGVEFKPYATFGLPHARVIAIESEREFGMSVLERLDEELKRRGDLFRNAGVQDVAGFRDAHPEEDMPRVLLIIDEFQEFFVKDDKIAQDASLLLDRLVRQGRAFGIHVLLGSQTLAGAYTLARSTIGQMAVRIALQCSEGDAHLILSEENTAARLLNRPGEAIYNDANGRFEGNHPFQVVWLPDSEREQHLQAIADLNGEATGKQIVFEGNVLAKLGDNSQLRGLLEAPAPEAVSPSPTAWLGSAVAIKEPTSLTFRRQSGANLLVVGQQDEMALGVMSAAILGAIAQQPSSEEASVRILDGTRPDAPEAGYWNGFAKKTGAAVEVARARDAAATIQSVAEELERRTADNNDTDAPVFLVIHNLARFRDLKKSDDYNFSFDDDAGPALDKQLATILREGPNYGIHAILWCDSYNNTIRFLDRASLRDLEMRVLFQMSANDSANLMDSPAASQLGAHRAILYSDELGESEKFRPYGLPDDEWLQWVGSRMSEREAGAPPLSSSPPVAGRQRLILSPVASA